MIGMMSDILFWACFAVGIPASMMVVTRKNPVYAAIWMLVAFVSFAGIYLSMDAAFLAAIHVIVYTGAILVLFLFVVMMLNLGPNDLGKEWGAGVRIPAALGAAVTVLLMVGVLCCENFPEKGMGELNNKEFGSIKAVSTELYGGPYLVHVEIVAVLLLVAMIGAVVLAKGKES